MKHFIMALLIIGASATAQSTPKRVTIAPAKPKVGGTVTVVYSVNAAPAALKNVDALTLDVLTVTSDAAPDGDLREIPMVKSGGTWKASVPVVQPGSKLLLFRFVSGDVVDDDNDNVWSVMVYDAKGRPVRGAQFASSFLYNYGIASFKRKQDTPMAIQELSAEVKAYPDNWTAVAFQWSMLTARGVSDSMRTAIRSRLDKQVAHDKNNDSLLARYPYWYDRIGDTARANEVRAYGISRAPQGFVALEARQSQARAFRDPAERLRILQQAMTEYPPKDSSSRQERYTTLAYTAMQAKQIDVAAEALKHVSNPPPYLYLNLASAQAKTGERLDLAEALSRKAVELAAVPSATPRNQYKTEKEWRNAADDLQASALSQLADVLVKEGKTEEGLAMWERAYETSRGEDADLNRQYVDALVKGKAYQRAVDVAMDVVAKGKGSDALIVSARLAYAGKEGSPAFDSLSAERRAAFNALHAAANEKGIAAVRAAVLKSRIHQPGINFTLSDLDGKPVSLASLRGKVVVVDFWATWCGPCKMSFPYLQKVYEKYQNNPSVAIYAVDCWERQKDSSATVENARAFRETNKYTWPVLIDDKNEVVTAYGVEGIPTKFIVDRDGTIAFKSIGYNGPDMQEELTQQIEVLLAGTTGRAP